MSLFPEHWSQRTKSLTVVISFIIAILGLLAHPAVEPIIPATRTFVRDIAAAAASSRDVLLAEMEGRTARQLSDIHSEVEDLKEGIDRLESSRLENRLSIIDLSLNFLRGEHVDLVSRAREAPNDALIAKRLDEVEDLISRNERMRAYLLCLSDRQSGKVDC